MKKKTALIVMAFALVAAIVAVMVISGLGGKKQSDDHLKLAERYLEELDYDRAIAEYRAALEIDSKNADAYIGLADAYMGKKDFSEAKTVLNEGYNKTEDRRLSDKLIEVETFETEDVQNADDAEQKLAKTEKGYYMDGSTLYIDTIHYTIEYLTGQNKYVYKKPWSKEIRECKELVVDADLVCDGDKSKAGEIYRTQSGLFMGNSTIETADIRINMDGVSDASFLLSECRSLKSANVFLNGYVEHLSYMFSNCKMLQNAYIALPVDSVRSTDRMFKGCESLLSADLIFDGPVESCLEMFEGCRSLTGMYVPFSISAETHYRDMFFNCSRLSSVTFPSVTVDESGMGALFNTDNSIGSYLFTSSWSVNTDKLANPIGDSFMNDYVIPGAKSGEMMIFITYSKPRPEWYRDFAVKLFQLENAIRLQEGSVLDIYYLSAENGEGTELDDMIKRIDGMIADAIDRMDKNGDFKGAQELRKIKDSVEGVYKFAEDITKNMP